jgi:hypothetical protein
MSAILTSYPMRYLQLYPVMLSPSLRFLHFRLRIRLTENSRPHLVRCQNGELEPNSPHHRSPWSPKATLGWIPSQGAAENLVETKLSQTHLQYPRQSRKGSMQDLSHCPIAASRQAASRLQVHRRYLSLAVAAFRRL